MVGNKGLHRGN